MRNSKKKVFHSLLSLMLCASMLIGTTFAWFTDSVTNTGNVIKSGKLDLEMYWTDDLDSDDWHNVEDDLYNTIFNYDNWEPGYTDVRYIKIVNNGNLALNYELTLTPVGSVGKLAEVINVYCANEGIEIKSREDLSNLSAIGLLDNVMNGGSTVNGTLLAAEQESPFHKSGETIVTLAMSMITTAGNDYQDESIGDGFSITALATQCPYEEDSLGSDYDANAEYPNVLVEKEVSATVTPVDGKVPQGGLTIQGGGIKADVPEGVLLEEGVDTLTIKITPLDKSASGITTVNDEILIPVDVHVEGVSEDNTVPIIIEVGAVLPKYLNMGNYTLIHVEDGGNVIMKHEASVEDLDTHNEFTYDSDTGVITVAMATFSEVVSLVDTANKWNGAYNEADKDFKGSGTETDPYLISNADELAGLNELISSDKEELTSWGDKCYKLICDIDIDGDNGKVWYPIGYHKMGDGLNSAGEIWYEFGGAFTGTFDGAGHTIENIYQNTWIMDGNYDAGYYKAAMGLFGYVNNGTVKNLTIDNFVSEGEFAPTGCITAYAAGESRFENILITNSHPQTYNTGVAGIVGWDNGGDSEKEASKYTFKNITVDEKTTISALWGSWDVAAAGIMGYLGEYSTAHLENCKLAPTIDVYNDVCGNYQYYWYRYCGMVIGTVDRINADGNLDLTGMITASNCTVDFGDRHEYYYCEFKENTQASYTDDYQFSRVPHSELNLNNEPVTCNHDHAPEEDKQAVYLPFRQLFGGYGWGVDGVEAYENIDIKNITGATQKFVVVDEVKEKDFLFRIGNGNAFPIGKLFEAIDESDINVSGVYVSVTSLEEGVEITGEFKLNEAAWKESTLKINGTGPAKITIQDYNFCAPTELYVEVVEAKNYSAETISSLGGNTVLLANTKLNKNGRLALQNASLYGNGFLLDVTEGRITGESITENYMIYINNSVLDNVQIQGAVYTAYGAMAGDSYNNPVVLSVGDNVIANSYIANCAAPVRVRSGNLRIVDSTLKGGNFANLDIRGGNILLENITTINQLGLNDKAEDGSEIVGLGIVAYYEGPSSSTQITIKGDLVQYNALANSTKLGNDYANLFIEEMFNEKYSDFQYIDGNVKWVNTGIISMHEAVGQSNIINTDQKNKSEYSGTPVEYDVPMSSLGTVNGYLYTTIPNESPEDKEYQFESQKQHNIIPIVKFDHSVNEMIKQEGIEKSCTFDPLTDFETITFADGDSFTWDVNILKSTNKEIEYTVWMNDKQYIDNILFDESGEYIIVFKYIDKNNYRLKEDGIVEKYAVEYEKSMKITVAEMKASAKNAEITFPLLGTYGTTKVVADGKTYIMPNLTGIEIPKYGDDLTFDANERKYGSLKADGKTSVDIYYPIIKTAMSGNYMVFPVFGNSNGTLVQIQDYEDNGTGAAMNPYNASTQTLPTNLSVSRGYTVQWSTDKDVVGSGSINYGSWTSGLLAFKYQSSSDTISCDVMSNYLSYYPDINLRSNDRNEQVMVAEYKYVDNKGDTFYYCVGYHIEERNKGYAFGETVPENSGGGCVTPDTLVTLADGSQKRIDEITYEDQLLVWDFHNGQYTSVPSALIVNHGYDDWTVIELLFEDGTIVKAVTAHAFYDETTNEFALIDDKNVSEYVGHSFVKADKDSYTTTKLVDYKVYTEYTESYTLVSAKHYNFITEGIISITNSMYPLQSGLVVGENMKYDRLTLLIDTLKYGKYTYSDFSEYVSYEQFVAFNGPYLKISVEKGYCTFDDILQLIEGYLNS